MNLTLEEYQLIEAYVNGELSEADQRDFEQELTRRPELNAEVKTQRDLRLGLRAIGIERALQQARQRYEERQAQAAEAAEDRGRVIPLGEPARKLPVRHWLAAASVAVLLGAGWLTYQHQQRVPDELVAQAEYELKSFPPLSPTNAPKGNTGLRNRQKLDWYLALVDLKNGKKTEARQRLERIASNPQHTYSEKAKAVLKKL